jgi:Tfp pilus assembly protein PilF
MAGANKHKEAAQLFEAIAKEAAAVGNFGLVKAAKSYIAYKEHQSAPLMEADPIQQAVFLLNSRQTEEALKIIDKTLKTQEGHAHLHYIKAIAHANAEQPELAEESLKKAIELDPALLNVYKLEPDFKPYRNTPGFAEIGSELT